jgi:2-C-methyl-D-erythritol 4-phosphate cytidylyltransferase
MPELAVILPAAGTSRRFGGNRNKLLEPLEEDITVLESSIWSVWNYTFTTEIFIATSSPEITKLSTRLQSTVAKDVRVCRGGPTRAHSVLNALREVPDRYDWVAVHDAARPRISQDLIDRTFKAAREYGAAAPALPLAQTIKQAAGPLPAKVTRTVPRHDLWAMQTPQIMRTADLRRAYDRCPIPLDQVTDDVQLLELIGIDVWLVPGEEANIKITTQHDLRLARLICRYAGQAD